MARSENWLRKFGPYLVAGWLLLGAQGAAVGTDAGAARALFFFSPDCAECDDLTRYLLPALRESYGDRLELAGVDVTSSVGSRLYAEAGSLGAPSEWPGRPVVLVGGRAWVGLEAVAAGLGDGFSDLATDPRAARWPKLEGLAEVVQSGLDYIRDQEAEVEVAPFPEARPRYGDRIANGLAVLVLSGMIVTLFYLPARVLGRIRRRGELLPIPMLAVLGLAISAYTAYTALAGVEATCGPIGSCNAVQQSEHSRLFGIPLGVLGVLGYLAISTSWLASSWDRARARQWRLVAWGFSFSGFLFSIWLTALEPFVIRATCLWCLGSAVIMTLLCWGISGTLRENRIAGRAEETVGSERTPR